MSSSSFGLNPAQREAVVHAQGPLLVLAGPGSGKTRVVTMRIARLIESGTPAKNILSVTFTNKAAREMRQRVRKLVPGGRAKDLTVATIHAACVRILREEIGVLGYTGTFSIYDEASQTSLMRTVLRDISGAGATGSPADVLAGVGAHKAGLVPAGALDEDARQRLDFVAMAGARYQEELRARNAIDFDDIILLTARLLREHEDVRERWQQRFRHVLVDEYQDTSGDQDEVLTLLSGGEGNLCVVGDDDQSIYRWRGARVEHILEFPRRFPGAKVVRLEQNYRSTQNVLAVANAAISQNANRHAKHLFTERGRGPLVSLVELEDQEEEAEFIAGEISLLANAPGVDVHQEASKHAIIYRMNDQVRALEQALLQAQLPYRILGGRSFFDRKEVIDVLSYLRLAANPKDEEALFRIVNTPSRGLGAKALQAMRDRGIEKGKPTWEVFRDVARRVPRGGSLFAEGGPVALDADEIPGLSARAARSIGDFVEVVDSVQGALKARSKTLVTDLLARISYKDEVERTYKDVKIRANRWNLAQEVQQSWEVFLDRPVPEDARSFLDAITLRASESDDDKPEGVTLATVHASKGLEFPSVYVAGLEEGIIPHSKSVDEGEALAEERRLFFVAVTRAQDKLTLTRSLHRAARGGKTVETIPSRFLEGLPEDAIETPDARAPSTEDKVDGYVARLRAITGAAEEAEPSSGD